MKLATRTLPRPLPQNRLSSTSVFFFPLRFSPVYVCASPPRVIARRCSIKRTTLPHRIPPRHCPRCSYALTLSWPTAARKNEVSLVTQSDEYALIVRAFSPPGGAARLKKRERKKKKRKPVLSTRCRASYRRSVSPYRQSISACFAKRERVTLTVARKFETFAFANLATGSSLGASLGIRTEGEKQ